MTQANHTPAWTVPDRYLVTLRDINDRMCGRYSMPMPDPDAKDYAQQLTAFAEFMHLELARSNSKQRRFCTFTDWTRAVEYKITAGAAEVATVWALFKAIGYDHKTRSYT